MPLRIGPDGQQNEERPGEGGGRGRKRGAADEVDQGGHRRGERQGEHPRRPHGFAEEPEGEREQPEAAGQHVGDRVPIELAAAGEPRGDGRHVALVEEDHTALVVEEVDGCHDGGEAAGQERVTRREPGHCTEPRARSRKLRGCAAWRPRFSMGPEPVRLPARRLPAGRARG